MNTLFPAGHYDSVHVLKVKQVSQLEAVVEGWDGLVVRSGAEAGRRNEHDASSIARRLF